MIVPVFAAERRHLLSIDISCPHGAQQQTRRQPLLPWIDGADRWTLDRFTDLVPLSGSVNKCDQRMFLCMMSDSGV